MCIIEPHIGSIILIDRDTVEQDNVYMKLETTIKRIGNRLGIIIPRSAITNASLDEGDVLSIHINGKNMIITREHNKLDVLDHIMIHQSNDNIFSMTLSENQLILAK